jgi:ribonuclease HII
MFFAEKDLFSLLQKQGKSGIKYIIALDEVGRGCVAGPVLMCASLWVECASEQIPPWISLVKDSKKLSSQKRQVCFESVLRYFDKTFSHIPHKNENNLPDVKLVHPAHTVIFSMEQSESLKEPSQEGFQCLGFCLGESSRDEVDSYNIWNAVQIAAGRALVGLQEAVLDPLKINRQMCVLLMDGNKSIVVPSAFQQSVQVTAVKGDDIFVSVGLSSILAKVYRDTFMESQENIYPQFGFAKHKGYGTALHLKKIQEFGLCPLHRLSFLKKYTQPTLTP